MSFASYHSHRTAIEIIRNDLSRFLKDLCKDTNHFAVISGFAWGATSQQMLFDVAVTYKSNMIAVIEYLDGDQKDLREAIQFTVPSVFLYTKALLFACYSKKTDTYVMCTKSSFKRHEHSWLEEISSSRILAKRIFDIAVESNIENDKDYYEKKLNIKFYHNNNKVLDPKWSREQLIEFNENEICRYSSLNSLFSTLKYGTFRMNGLPGMNDKDEGLFAWNMINDTKKLSNDEVKKRKALINNAFIISYSYKSKIDDLIQWRLYGDDAKGVCCVYSVLQDKIDDRFFLHPIKYIEPPQKGKYPTDALLATLKKYVDNQSGLAYTDLSPLIFYYKHKDYEPEAEVRLLVDNKNTSAYNSLEFKREWLLTNSNNIPNPYIDIPLKDFPLKLERILLGPNMNDIDTIQVQLETMLKELGINAVVEPSKITSYRNPTK